jgi:hypothetical protein
MWWAIRRLRPVPDAEHRAAYLIEFLSDAGCIVGHGGPDPAGGTTGIDKSSGTTSGM